MTQSRKSTFVLVLIVAMIAVAMLTFTVTRAVLSGSMNPVMPSFGTSQSLPVQGEMALDCEGCPG